MSTKDIKLKSINFKIFNLVVIGIAIILVIFVKNNYKDFFSNLHTERHIQNFQNSPQNSPQYFNPSFVNGINSNMYQQPMVFQRQMYPAKAPWYPQTGRPCETGTCGATGTCQDGICQRNDEYQEPINN